MRKMLVVDDIRGFVEGVRDTLEKLGVEAWGIVVSDEGFEFIDPKGFFAHMHLEAAVREVDTVFLDHTMPTPGDVLLVELRRAGLPSDTKIIGTSSRHQPYASMQVSTGVLREEKDLAKLLNL